MTWHPYELTDGDVQIEAELEIGRRLRTGSLSHLFLFTVVILSTSLFEHRFWLGMFVGSGVMLMSISRFFLSRAQKKFYPKKRKTWLYFFDVSMAVTAGLWGLLCEEILRRDGFFSADAVIILLITTGLTAGAANSLNPSFKRALTFIGLTLGIPFASFVWSSLRGHPSSSTFAVIFLIYFGFLSMQIRNQYEIFWNLLRTKKGLTDLNRTLDQEVRDRTKRLVTTEAQLIESAKMAALGEMAGGIAHEINTPLAVISLNAEQAATLAEEGIADTETIRASMKAISDTVARISDIITGMKTFSRDASQDKFTVAPVRQIVDETLALCRKKLEYGQIQIRVRPIDENLGIRCRPVQISQVLLNLISNACDAVQPLSEKWIEISARATSRGVEISVTDSGRGVAATARDKLFQPFFTTKAVGKGTGLGLSISTGIMEAHRGELVLDRESLNTRFVLSYRRSMSAGSAKTAA